MSKIYSTFKYLSMHGHVHPSDGVLETRTGHQTPWRWSKALHYGFWGLNASPPGKEHALLTAAPPNVRFVYD